MQRGIPQAIYSTDLDDLIGDPAWPTDIPLPSLERDVRITEFEVGEYRERRDAIGLASLSDENAWDSRVVQQAEARQLRLDDAWIEMLTKRAAHGEVQVPLRFAP